MIRARVGGAVSCGAAPVAGEAEPCPEGRRKVVIVVLVGQVTENGIVEIVEPDVAHSMGPQFPFGGLLWGGGLLL